MSTGIWWRADNGNLYNLSLAKQIYVQDYMSKVLLKIIFDPGIETEVEVRSVEDGVELLDTIHKLIKEQGG